MYVTMMMTDQMLELPPLLNGEVPMMHHMINGDATQQVILVQVNPGETFTIRREDGTLQCIQGPAEVPMMSPNGSIPPIHVPPGYISQVLEDNTGVRRVVVTPHSECYPPSYSPALSPTHHLPPPYMTHPHFIPASHTAYYPPASPGDVPPHQYYQHRLPPIYPEEIFPLYNMSTILSREEYCKPQPKKPKERSSERPSLSRVGTPPSSSYKSGPACSTTSNGYSKNHAPPASGAGTGGSPGNKRAERRSRGSPKQSDSDPQDPELEARREQDVPSGMEKPQVLKIQARTALVSWSRAPAARGTSDGVSGSCSYELLLADKGCDGKYRVVYSGEELQYTLTDLRPATDYHVRVSAVCNSVKGPHSEARTFTTHSAPPDTPLPPRLSHRTKSSLTLQWKPPVDNGSKITSYVLEWDEGKKNSVFRECYFGHQRHFKVMRLCPAVGYTFRVAALNDIGSSGFSPEVVFHTTGSLPQMPVAPRLLQSGASWVGLEWSRPSSYGPDEALTYTLEMQDETKGAEFQVVYTGVDVSSRVEGLSRNTQYRFRLTSCSAEWKSSPSSILVCRTSVDKPGPPTNPTVTTITSHTFCVSWEPPQDDGGNGDLSYLLEISEETSEAVAQWVVVYCGSQREHVCEDLKAGTRYSVRVSSESAGGHSLYTESLVVCTLSLPPGPCNSLSVHGNVKHREVCLQWEAPVCDDDDDDDDDEGVLYSVEMITSEDDVTEVTEVYKGSHTQCIVGNLQPGATYRFRVRASSDAGFGPFSEFLDVTTAAGPPGACGPPVISLTSHDSAVVSWVTDESSGADITGYRLDWGRQEDALELVYSGTETSCQISQLEAAVSYCCRIQAMNQAGAGPYSEPAWCRTPAAAPNAVSSLYVQDGVSSASDTEPFCPSTCLALAWDEPNCNGQEITGYTLMLGEELITVGVATCTVIRNLQPDTEYSVQVRAENAVGAGQFGPSLLVRTRPLPPNPPRLECGSAGPQSLKLRWGDWSKNPNPDTDITYILQMEDRNQRFVVIYRGPSHTFKVQRLNELSRYSFRIQAVSRAGDGPHSDIFSFTTTKSVPPTLKAPRVCQLEGNACEVSWENVPPMRGDRVTYVLQVLGGRESEYRQVYKGEDTVFQLFGLQWNTDYRLRVFVCRRCADTAQELCGSFSPSTHFCPRRVVSSLSVDAGSVSTPASKQITDQQFASIIVVGVASFSIFIAYLLQLLI